MLGLGGSAHLSNAGSSAPVALGSGSPNQSLFPPFGRLALDPDAVRAGILKGVGGDGFGGVAPGGPPTGSRGGSTTASYSYSAAGQQAAAAATEAGRHHQHQHAAVHLSESLASTASGGGASLAVRLAEGTQSAAGGQPPLEDGPSVDSWESLTAPLGKPGNPAGQRVSAPEVVPLRPSAVTFVDSVDDGGEEDADAAAAAAGDPNDAVAAGAGSSSSAEADAVFLAIAASGGSGVDVAGGAGSGGAGYLGDPAALREQARHLATPGASARSAAPDHQLARQAHLALQPSGRGGSGGGGGSESKSGGARVSRPVFVDHVASGRPVSGGGFLFLPPGHRSGSAPNESAARLRTGRVQQLGQLGGGGGGLGGVTGSLGGPGTLPDMTRPPPSAFGGTAYTSGRGGGGGGAGTERPRTADGSTLGGSRQRLGSGAGSGGGQGAWGHAGGGSGALDGGSVDSSFASFASHPSVVASTGMILQPSSGGGKSSGGKHPEPHATGHVAGGTVPLAKTRFFGVQRAHPGT